MIYVKRYGINGISIRSYNPPFVMPSFVKLDSLTRVDSSDWGNLQILNSGRTLDKAELERIKGII